MDLGPSVEVAIVAAVQRIQARWQSDPTVTGSSATVGAVGIAVQASGRIRVRILVNRRRGLAQVARTAGTRVGATQQTRVAVLIAGVETGYASRTSAENRVSARRRLGAKTSRCCGLGLGALAVTRHDRSFKSTSQIKTPRSSCR